MLATVNHLSPTLRKILTLGVLMLIPALAIAQETDPAEITIGERLFLETRFSEFFARSTPDINQFRAGDPAVEVTHTTGAPLPGPFAGQAMNCRSCHMVDEHVETPGGGMRAYADFARRSPIPERGDGNTVTLRNSPTLVSIFRNVGRAQVFHVDGEFSSMTDLVIGTFTGRNFGWLKDEKKEAIAHIAKVIREDDGKGPLAADFGSLAYSQVLKGENVPAEFRLPKRYRLDVQNATDEEILHAIGKLVAVYVNNISFSQDENGVFIGSPYDLFLKKNNLPKLPAQGESDVVYSARLLSLLEKLRTPLFVDRKEGKFEFHDQPFVFGPVELEGLKTFLRGAGKTGAGNCASCHPAPAFTDFKFHNTGASQEEYEAIHGKGSFRGLSIPGAKARRALHSAKGEVLNSFAAVPSKDDLKKIDLGVWNVFMNPEIRRPQRELKKLLCSSLKAPCSTARLLRKAIAAFKTPTLRDLGHSGPYLHTGAKDSLKEVIEFYREMSKEAQAGRVVATSPEIRKISLSKGDVAPLVSFLRSLNEDYS